MYRVEVVLRERQPEDVDQRVGLGAVVRLVLGPQEVDLCSNHTARDQSKKKFPPPPKKVIWQKKNNGTVRQPVAPVVAEIDKDGRQVPREGRVPGQFHDPVVFVNVKVGRVFQTA